MFLSFLSLPRENIFLKYFSPKYLHEFFTVEITTYLRGYALYVSGWHASALAGGRWLAAASWRLTGGLESLDGILAGWWLNGGWRTAIVRSFLWKILSTVQYAPLLAVHYLLFTIYCPLSPVHCPLSAVHCPLSNFFCPKTFSSSFSENSGQWTKTVKSSPGQGGYSGTLLSSFGSFKNNWSLNCSTVVHFVQTTE